MTRAAWRHAGGVRLALRLLLLVAIILLVNRLAAGLADRFALDLRPSNEVQVHRMLMTAMLAYVVLMAIPFVPGVEIGLAVLSLLGPPAVPLVYGATLVGLTLAYGVGRLVPARLIVRLCRRFGLERSAGLLERAAASPGRVPHRLIEELAPGRLARLVIRHRLIALGVALNLPGNAALGGGGGLAMVAGATRLYSVPAFLLTIAVAVAPLPLAVLVFGTSLFA